jgi:putative ABC transport system permease protein
MAAKEQKMATLRQDLSYSLRSLRKTPVFTAVAIVTLALGIGANSAIFSVVNAVLLRPLPFGDAKRVVNLAWDGGGHLQALSATKFQYWRDHTRSFDAMATWRSSLARAAVDVEPLMIRALAVSPDFFAVVGNAPARGHGFTPADLVPGGPSVAIISHAMWETRFARAADVIGRTMRLDRETVIIAGVLAESFAFPSEEEPIDVIVPLRMTVDPNDVAEDWPAIARLRDGVTHEQARAETAAMMTGFRTAYPGQVSDQDRGMTLATFNELYVDPRVQRALWALMSAVAFVLLIACANVANLFLSRATARRREIVVRAALGASQARIMRLVLTESLLVALAAAALGLVLGKWVAGALIALSPVAIPRLTSAGIDWRVLVFTAAISFGTSLLFGGAAAWPAARLPLAAVLNEASRGSSGPGRMRRGLLVVQSALAMILLVGAGLLVGTVIRLTSFDRGFDVDGLVAVRLTTPPAPDATAQELWEFERRVLEQLEDVPPIASVAAANSLPLERGVNTPMTIAGRPDLTGTVEWRAVTPGYFETLGITRIAGRSFEATDAAGGPPVAIVNEAFAHRYFAGASPIGQQIDVGRFRGALTKSVLDGGRVEIVGVVEDVRDVSLRTEPRRTIYVPQAQAPTRLSTLLRAMPVFIARPRSPGGDVERTLREAVHAADPSLPPPQLFPLDAAVARSLARERFGATLLSVLAALALALTALGIHGVLAYSIQQRRREIGIRMALGARAEQVARLVMVQGVAPVIAGLAIGVAAAIGLSRFVAAFLWGVRATDPTTYWSVAAILLGVGVAASWIPARTAAKLDPVSTLAHD